jgi:hypothetical protein
MQAVRGQQNQHYEIRNQQRDIKGIGVVQALKSSVEEVLTDVLTDPLRGCKAKVGSQARNEIGVQRELLYGRLRKTFVNLSFYLKRISR